jgi:flagellar motor switch protein FliN/FliY
VTESLMDRSSADAATASTLQGVAQAVLALLPVGEPLVAGNPGRAREDLDGQAVSVRFTGSTSGEFVLIVDRPVLDALASSPLGPLDPTHALAPALEAAAQAIGRVALGPAQLLPVTPALDSLLAKPGALVVPLLAGTRVRAFVGLSLAEDAGVAAPVAAAVPSIQELASARAHDQPGRADRAGLELLRGVEMDVTAELGRTRMTLNELLSLSDGAVIELDRAAGAAADLLVNGRLIARGEVVVIDENFGLRITEIVSDHGAR